ncbi:MAG: cytochrome C oxidase Cbb3 [Terriglobia bacterium]|nr:MAG: cytochrome C oxidase Cbb3 [Terriglobia bacterium]
MNLCGSWTHGQASRASGLCRRWRNKRRSGQATLVRYTNPTGDGMMRIGVWVLLGCLPAVAQDGAELFRNHCSPCHRAGSSTSAPLPETLRSLPAQTIRTALETGKMRAQGTALSPAERNLVANYLGKAERPQTIPASASCSGAGALVRSAPAWNGWGADLTNSRFQKAPGLTRDNVPKLKLKWAFGYPGVTTAFGSPSVFGGRVFAGSADGTVYSLDAKSGCVHWTYRAADGVRTAITISDDGQAAYFGDLEGNVYGVNANTGALLWKTRADEHLYAEITGTPKLQAGRLYVPVSGGAEQVAAANPAFACCTFRGSMVALDARNGERLWKTYSVPDEPKVVGLNTAGTVSWGPSGAALWSSPTIDVQKKAVYAASGVNYSNPPTGTSDAILAFDMEKGRQLWSRQLLPADIFNFGCTTESHANCPPKPGRDADIGAPPVLRSLPGGRRILVVGAKSGTVYGLDPDQEGKPIWETKIASGGPQGGIMWGAAADEKLAYFAISDWDPGKPEAGGGMVAVDIATGKKVWAVPASKPTCLGTPGCSAAQPAPVTLIPGVLFAASLDGHIRAYEARAGAVVWDFDTRQEFQTVDGIAAHGGSINGSGPVVAQGMVFANSGYSRLPVMPGNVLLAFSVDGK